MFRVCAGAGALRRRRPAGQGPRAGGHAPLQESYWTGQSTHHSRLRVDLAGFLLFLLARSSLFTFISTHN